MRVHTVKNSAVYKMTNERLRELALDIASAAGVMRVEMYRGVPYASSERDYQDAVRQFDAALREVFDER